VKYFYTFLLSFSFLLVFSIDSKAQLPFSKTDTVAMVPVWPEDTLGRRTPRGAVDGFLKAVATEDYKNAILYLKFDPTLTKENDQVKLARALQNLIEKNGRIYPYSRISEETGGQKDDNLNANLDRVGEATVNEATFDLILEQSKDKAGAPIWQFSSESIQRIPVETLQVQDPTLIEKLSPATLLEHKWADVPLAHWLSILVLITAAYFLAGGITRFLAYLIPLVWRKAKAESIAGIIQSFVKPVHLYLGVWLFVVGSRQVGVSILIRQRLSDITIIVGLVAVLLLFWQLLDFISTLVEKRLRLQGNHSGVSALLFMRRAAKVALVIMGVLAILDTFGFNVTTWLTALGIGGIALALGTQKTVENLVGSVTIIADHPVRVGDFCKAGDVSGTVEQIGMRTTQIRTGARTIVSIPNGEFSSMKIENFAPRDKFLFNPIFGLRYETTPKQIRNLLAEIRKVLQGHPKIDPSVARVRFIALSANALNVEVYTYIMTRDNDEFLEIQEELFLEIMDVVEACGTGFAFPSQTLYLANDQGLSAEKSKVAEEKIKTRREAVEKEHNP
jgi:MscS family membrane protein